MEMTAYIDRYKQARYSLFKWRYELALLQKIVLAFGFACLTGLAAQVRFYLPWTPVPITGQTFAVLLSAVLLGRWAGISQAMYVTAGAAGLPWFSGWRGGVATIAGPTGGYLTGFVFAALFLGHFVDRYIRARSFLPMLGLMSFASFVLIHGPGLLGLYLWLSSVKGTPVGLWELLVMGTVPFIAGDLTKVVLAALVARGITPKRAYNGETEARR